MTFEYPELYDDEKSEKFSFTIDMTKRLSNLNPLKLRGQKSTAYSLSEICLTY